MGIQTEYLQKEFSQRRKGTEEFDPNPLCLPCLCVRLFRGKGRLTI